MRLSLSVPCLAILGSGTSWADALIKASFVDMPAHVQADFEMAVDIWERCLVSAAPIRIRAQWIDRGPTGFAMPRIVRNHAWLPVKDVWYPSALANALAGERDNDEDDMNLFFSAATNWYFASDTPIAGDETDFINVAVHEIAHGLGISSGAFIPWDGEQIGALGYPNEYIDYFSYSFEFATLDGTPSLYDSFIRLGDGRGLLDFPNPSRALARAIQNPTVSFTGERAIAANDGYPVGVVPDNLSHIPQASQALSPIMLPDSGQGESIHQPDAILLGMLQDLGWQIEPGCLP